MKALLLKDAFVLMKQLKFFIFVIPLIALTGDLTFSLIAIFLGAVLPMTAIAYDEQSKWDEYAIMMPYSNKDLVLSKYLLGYICILGASVLVMLGQLVVGVFILNHPFQTGILALPIAGALLFTSINMPILFRFGSEKGRYIYIFALAFIGAGSSFLKTIPIDPSSIPIYILFIFVLLANFLSIQLSIRIKTKQ